MDPYHPHWTPSGVPGSWLLLVLGVAKGSKCRAPGYPRTGIQFACGSFLMKFTSDQAMPESKR